MISVVLVRDMFIINNVSDDILLTRGIYKHHRRRREIDNKEYVAFEQFYDHMWELSFSCLPSNYLFIFVKNPFLID